MRNRFPSIYGPTMPLPHSAVQLSCHFFVLLCLGLCCSVSLWSQTSANISGIVADQSGAAVGSAGVGIKNLETGASRSATTDAGGRYQVFALPVGSYEVRATKDGFATGLLTGIRLVVGQ